MSVHPYVIHFPIVLILLWPIVDGCGLLIKRTEVSKVGLVLLLAAVAASLLGTVTGQAAFDRAVELHVDPALLETHGDKGGLVPWLLLAVTLVRTLGVFKLKQKAHAAAIVLGVALWPLIYVVGQTGGALVYEHAVGVNTGRNH